ncbi:hypothetical protein [Hymenobacter metallicola]|uniref:DUF2029 domain-containing protein n=1 Tax=Hymenobacter metallicola TaxID=2563114 RepID=A0A4Z0QI01_9BACT|nr:hypothetical protein [Hymenobacter metallicola]TGE28919.1 hypothetical protein E5K02_05505 [Hymenobacter metallicola]
MRRRVTAGQLTVALLSLGAYAVLAYATPRAHFGQLLGLYSLAFGAYFWLLWRPLPLGTGLLVALVARLLWLPATPALSDDYYRFRWDGALVANGQNPYRHRPDELVPVSDVATEPSPLAALSSKEARQLYTRLNSPHYYSVYPPVSQALFGLGHSLFPTTKPGFLLVLRLYILAAETVTALLLLALLRQFGLPAQRALDYLLNPLVIVELSGNLHFEALVICGVLAALWLLARGRLVLSAGVLAGAIGAKLLPLLVLPLLLRRLGWRRFLRYTALCLAAVLALFLPFLSADLLQNLSHSLDLYFHKFEFNASLYYLLRLIGYWYTGYNQIARLGTLLGLAVVVWVLGLIWLEKRPTLASLPQTLLLTLTGYFALATTVHPWYITSLVAMSVFSRYRYALVWSALIPLSYAAYQTKTYTENLGLVGLEYGVVAAVLLWEYFRLKGSVQHSDTK